MHTLLAADSFRVRQNPDTGEAEVRDFDRHLARFSGAVREVLREAGYEDADARFAADAQGLSEARFAAFLADAREEIAAFGEGFPRLELWRADAAAPERLLAEPSALELAPGLTLRLALRPLPPLGETIELRTAPAHGLAEMEYPMRKGPNIERYGALNRELGAEALLLDSAGRVREGATTSILWWRGETLCLVESEARVHSVTEWLLIEAAGVHGIDMVRTHATPAELTEHEAWAVNALHGIRPVATIDGVPLPALQPARLAQFRGALDHTWERVTATAVTSPRRAH